METPVQDIIIGNVPGACGTDTGCYKGQGMKCEKHTSTNETKVTHEVVSANDEAKTETEIDHSGSERDGPPLEQVAAVQTRAMETKEKLPPKSILDKFDCFVSFSVHIIYVRVRLVSCVLVERELQFQSRCFQ